MFFIAEVFVAKILNLNFQNYNIRKILAFKKIKIRFINYNIVYQLYFSFYINYFLYNNFKTNYNKIILFCFELDKKLKNL